VAITLTNSLRMSVSLSSSPAAADSLHPHLVPVQSLLGTWRGRGRGEFPTLQSFEYNEDVTFTLATAGRPVLAYNQVTSHPVTHRTLHCESGFWRLSGQQRIELIITQVSGINEVDEGHITRSDAEALGNGSVNITVESRSIQRSSSAKAPHVSSIRREFSLLPSAGPGTPATLQYTVSMSTDNITTLTRHLTATLIKQTAE